MGGDAPAPSTSESMQSILTALTTQMPALMQAYNQQVLPTAQATAAASQAINPIEQQLANDNKVASAQGDLNVLNGPGKELATQATALDKSINGGYYDTRDALAKAGTNLLNSYDPNGLSGSESAQVERGLNRMNQSNGTLNSGSNIQTVKNAASFGDALGAKKAAIGAAINSVGQNLAGLKNGIDPYGRTSVVQPTSFVSQATNNTMNSGNSLLNSATQANQQSNQINADRRDTIDRISEATGSLPSG